MSKEELNEMLKNMKKEDGDTLALVILKQIKDSVSLTMETVQKNAIEKTESMVKSVVEKNELVEKYTNEKIGNVVEKVGHLDTKIDGLNTVILNQITEQNNWFKAVSDELKNRKFADDNFVGELDKLSCRIDEMEKQVCSTEVKKNCEEISQERLRRKNVKQKVHDDNQAKIMGLPAAMFYSLAISLPTIAVTILLHFLK